MAKSATEPVDEPVAEPEPAAEPAPEPVTDLTDAGHEPRKYATAEVSPGQARESEWEHNVIRQINLAIHAGRSMHGKKVHGIDDFFQAIDTDGSQFVDRDELSKGLQLLDITVSDDQLAQLVTVMDPTGNRKISYFELKGELHKQARLVPPPVRARADLFLLGCLADIGPLPKCLHRRWLQPNQIRWGSRSQRQTVAAIRTWRWQWRSSGRRYHSGGSRSRRH